MRRSLLPLAALLAFPLYAQVPAAAPSSIKISAHTERPTAVYQQGEKVTFLVELEDKGVAAEGEIKWTLLKDGLPLKQEGKAPLVGGKASVIGQLDEPGFLQLRASYQADPKAAALTAMAGADVDATKIKPSLPVPEDFDAFWAAQKERLAKIASNLRLSPLSSSDPKIEVFDLQADCVGAPVSGYFARPTGAQPKSLPILLSVHGAGVRSSIQSAATNWASKGFLALDINAHGLPNGQPEAFYKEQTEGALKSYAVSGRESRETIYFLGMFHRLMRALDVLTAQPEWDGKTVVVFGTSQGGYQAIAAAGLDSRVTFFAAGVPAGCDHSGMVVDRIAGWPKLVSKMADGKPDPNVLNNARYFDTMNFATRTKAVGCIFTVGFIDTVCPPSSVYATYNQLSIPKEIFHDIPSGHTNSLPAMDAMLNAILKHAQTQKAK